MLNHLRLLQTPLLRRLRLPQGFANPLNRPVDCIVYPLHGQLYCPQSSPDLSKTVPDPSKTAPDSSKTASVRPKFGQVACKLPSCPLCCRQVAPRCLRSGLKPVKMPFWSHLGSFRGPQNLDFPYVFVGFWAHRLFALRSLKIAQDGPKMPPMWPKMAPRRPQDGPKTAPRWPKMAPRWPKMVPRWFQDGPRWPREGPR